MKFKGTLALALVGLALLAVVLFVKEPAPADEGPDAKYLFKMDEAKIRRITLFRDGAAIAAVRGNRKWTLEKPVTAAASKDEWNNLALALATFDYDRVVDEKGGNPARYGLDRPDLAVTFEDEKSRAYKVEFGLENPTGSFYYARRGGEPKVYLVSRYTRDKFAAGLEQLREGNALRFDPFTAGAMDLQRPTGQVKLAKKNSSWFLEAPVAARADDTEVDNLLRKIGEQRIADHLDAVEPARVKTAFGPVRYRVSLALDQGERQILELGADSPFGSGSAEVLAYNVTRDDYFTVPGAFVAGLDAPAESLRSRGLAEFYPFEIKGVTVWAGRDKTVLRRDKDDRWLWRDGAAERPLDRQRVEDWLEALRSLKAAAFIDQPGSLAAYGLEPPAVKVILDVENKPGTSLLFGREAEGLVFARNTDYPAVVRVSAAEWGKAAFKPSAWLSKPKK